MLRGKANMGVKVGRIARIEPPPAGKVCRVTLESGDQVYATRQQLETALADILPDADLVFVERGLLGRVAWIGTLQEVPAAVASGQVKPHEAVEAGLHADGSLPTVDEALEMARKSFR